MSRSEKWTDDQVKAVMLADPHKWRETAIGLGMTPAYAQQFRGYGSNKRCLRLRAELGLNSKNRRSELRRLIDSVHRELS